MNMPSWTEMLRRPSFLIGLSFAIWIAAFWRFLSGDVPLTSDAVSYYDHTKFFIDQLGRGQFALWDPHWSGGVPNDFFLRRIGPYNPFFLITLVLNKLGLKYYYASMVFQAGYFFFGMTGFYLLCRKLLKHDTAAFLSFLVLLFSALGTRMFDTYMLLVTIPVIWFFYFLVSFFMEPRREQVAGLMLVVMLLLTTYIPLYFLVIFLFFIVVYIIVCGKDVPGRIATLVEFTRKNKIFMGVCVVLLCLAVIPGLSFFTEAGKGNIQIPGRHYNTDVKNVLAVEPQLLSPWSIMEEFFFSSYYTDLTRIAFAIVYVPLFAFIVLGAGLFVRFSCLFVFLFLWSVLLVLFSMPIGFPLYELLYSHLGFVKYFRNLHFLLWFVLLPVFALFVGEVWKRLEEQRNEWPRWSLWALAGGAHLLALFFIVQQGDALVFTYLALVTSAGVWALLLFGVPWARRWVLLLLLGAVFIQPVSVFHYLARNYETRLPRLSYDHLGKFNHKTEIWGESRAVSDREVPIDLSGMTRVGLYYTTDIYQQFRETVDPAPLERYEFFKFYLYGHQPPANDMSAAFSGEVIKNDSDRLRVIRFTANDLVIKTDLEAKKFVVYNDVNFKGWSLKVNGKPAELFTANGAYKGFWLPAGKSVAALRYGSFKQHFLNWLLLAACYGMCLYTAVLYWRRRDA